MPLIAGPQLLRLPDVTDLHADLVAGEIRVSEGPSFVDVSRVAGPPIAVEHAGGVLKIAQRKRMFRCTVVVHVGVAPGAKVAIRTVSAHVVVRLDGTLDVETVSGDLEVAMNAGVIRFGSVSGAANAVLGKDCRFDGRTVSGDLAITGCTPELVSVATTSGRVRVSA
ncbi:hypothetical protein [Lentzea sp. NPDC051838]|uniref:hypothetical protein n=1 Tax=Lentzea sp. NPDC051838 TaxID=3154849 RepID=UPI00342F8B88